MTAADPTQYNPRSEVQARPPCRTRSQRGQVKVLGEREREREREREGGREREREREGEGEGERERERELAITSHL